MSFISRFRCPKPSASAGEYKRIELSYKRKGDIKSTAKRQEISDGANWHVELIKRLNKLVIYKR